ncbi:MAG: NAD-glutamate dehydrogenase [Planctomycetes bacterium]|nr:NAD-glutamate dehydrogenase [Planctomycetota bacterium]
MSPEARPSTLDPAITARLDALQEHLAKDPGGSRGRLAMELVRRIRGIVPIDPTLAIPVEALAERALEVLDFLDGTDPDVLQVKVYERERLGVPGERDTIVRVSLRDQPFLYDTVLETLMTLEHTVRHGVHPVLAIDRDANFAITGLRDPHGAVALESFMHFELQPLDEAGRENLQRVLERNLLDAVHVVADHGAMLQRADQMMAWLRQRAEGSPQDRHELEEAALFLQWLKEDRFVFLGYREYQAVERDGKPCVAITRDSGLGLLRTADESNYREPVPWDQVDEVVRQRLERRVFPLIAKTNRASTVHRAVPMDYIGIKTLDDAGNITGERRLLGLFTSRAFGEDARDIPVLRRKLETILAGEQVTEGSHDWKEIMSVFSQLPKSELFLTDTEEIAHDIRTIIALRDKEEVHVTYRADFLRRGVTIMVILPRQRFNTTVREKIQEAFSELTKGEQVDCRVALGDEATVRLHFYYLTPKGYVPTLNVAELEERVVALTRRWDDALKDRLRAIHGKAEGYRLHARYGLLFPEIYVQSTPTETALHDIHVLEQMARDGALRVAIQPGPVRKGTKTHIVRVYRMESKFRLSALVPLLNNFGLSVIDEMTFRLESDEVRRVYVHSLRVQDAERQPLTDSVVKHLEPALIAGLLGHIEDDRLNGLVVRANLDHLEVDLLRTYRNYLLQTSRQFQITSIHAALLNNGACVRKLVDWFHARFDPTFAGGLSREERSAQVEALGKEVEEAIEDVADIMDYRRLARFHNLIEATLRTNYYQRPADDHRIAVKMQCAAVDVMPEPRPLYEIYVHGPNVEGVHLRSGPVARGGLRWSDRRDDFRTEVLGLMKAQRTKNSVIVPVGSKGGFVIRNLPSERQAMLATVETSYKTFIKGLLDITDNIVDGKVVHPPQCVVYDGEDPYLVVAADKGTATFSDIANGVAKSYGFWLDDAFASGGSNGYDHKKLGITARGGWESVMRHFREMGIDVQNEPFTAIGIGDMGGDVFGNGLLCSRQTKLLAAFNHRHIFLDPTPDPATSFDERQRLFDTRGGWDQYDVSKISAGGGVFERSAKSIRLSDPVRTMLDVTAERLSGDELIRAVLKMPVDLLWNGGIGTYVKATTQTHADADDASNDDVRIDARELRAKVVGEGGNLGITQRARIEYARDGGRLNTDFIDNSGGVDISDHEVNLKILFAELIRGNALTLEDRNALLAELSDEVRTMVLEDNYRQSLVLSLEQVRSSTQMTSFQVLINELESTGLLDRDVEFLPSNVEMDDRAEHGEGLTRPELSVVLAYSKIETFRRLLASTGLEHPDFQSALRQYFPSRVRERFGDVVARHRLQREIIATVLTNMMTDRMGVVWPSQTARTHGITTCQVARAFLITNELLRATERMRAVDALDNTARADAQHLAYLTIARAHERLLPFALEFPSKGAGFRERIDQLAPRFDELERRFDSIPVDWVKDRVLDLRTRLESEGFDPETAQRIAVLDHLARCGEILLIAERTGRPAELAMETYYRVGDQIEYAHVLAEAVEAPTDSEEDRIAKELLTQTLRKTYQQAVTTLLAKGGTETELRAILDQWSREHATTLQSIRSTLVSARARGSLTLGSLFVLIDRYRQMQEDIDAENPGA